MLRSATGGCVAVCYDVAVATVLQTTKRVAIKNIGSGAYHGFKIRSDRKTFKIQPYANEIIYLTENLTMQIRKLRFSQMIELKYRFVPSKQ